MSVLKTIMYILKSQYSFPLSSWATLVHHLALRPYSFTTLLLSSPVGAGAALLRDPQPAPAPIIGAEVDADLDIAAADAATPQGSFAMVVTPSQVPSLYVVVGEPSPPPLF
jgi:hypothetical protein